MDLSRQRKYLTIQFSLVVSILITVLYLCIISYTYIPSIPAEPLKILAVSADKLKPEHLERLLYLSGLVVLCIVSYLSVIIINIISKKFTDIYALAKMNKVIVIAISILYILVAIFGLLSDGSYFVDHTCLVSWYGMILSLLITIVIWLYSKEMIIKSELLIAIECLMSFISFLVIVIIALYCIYGTSTIKYDSIYDGHFNAVFHSVVQVYLGKQLLVDLTNMYGLYPHFLEPYFKIIGLSVGTFTATMALLMALSLILLLKYLLSVCKNKIVAMLGFVTTCYLCILYSKLALSPDPYFQYFPLRFLFPVLVIYLSYNYLKNAEDKRIYFVTFIFSVIAILWNLDTGLVVFGSWMALLFYRDFLKRDYRKLLIHSAHGIIALMMIFGMGFLYMRLRYGQHPDLELFFNYQQIFYYYGFMMLPMRIIHPWNLVIGVYVIGLVYSLVHMVNQEDSINANVIFFLSIIGFGLFAYFQGRSANSNLSLVSYPALLIFTIFADAVVYNLKAEKKIIPLSASLLLISFFCMGATSFAMSMPTLFGTTKSRIIPSLRNESTPITEVIDFVKANSVKGENLLILSNHSGIFHLASETTSPIRIPSPTELYLISEYEQIYKYLKSPACRKIIVDLGFAKHNPAYIVRMNDYIMLYFNLTAIAPGEGVALFTRK